MTINNDKYFFAVERQFASEVIELWQNMRKSGFTVELSPYIYKSLRIYIIERRRKSLLESFNSGFFGKK